jgi:site-specific DNA-methyltransferase (adenine-specific)
MSIHIEYSDFRDVTWPKDIDLIVTSPPYKNEDNYSDELIQDFGKLAWSNLKNNSLLFMNFGHLAHYKNRPFKAAMILEECGFDWVDTITWVKNHYRPLQGNKRVNNLTEFVFMMAKGKPTIDRLSIGVSYVDKTNIKRWAATGGKDLKCGGNVWYIPYETVKDKSEKLHNDRFPIGLPETCIKLAGIDKESLVVDPFVGSGTTAVASSNMNMNFWGTESNLQYVDVISRRIAQIKL